MTKSNPKENLAEDTSIQNQTGFNRRRFLQLLTVSTTAAVVNPLNVLGAQDVIVDVENPLKHYPNRGWEKDYLDQYHYDRTFTWICAPNDTHMCRMRAFVKK